MLESELPLSKDLKHMICGYCSYVSHVRHKYIWDDTLMIMEIGGLEYNNSVVNKNSHVNSACFTRFICDMSSRRRGVPIRYIYMNPAFTSKANTMYT